MTAYRDSYNNVYRDGADQQTTIAVGRDKALATMTIKYLHDLSALQVPQINLAVFAPRHNPLAARDTEARGDAVL